jgi:hypothetical protein
MTEIDCQGKDLTLHIMEETNQPLRADTRRDSEGKVYINLLMNKQIKGIQLLILSFNYLQDINQQTNREYNTNQYEIIHPHPTHYHPSNPCQLP